MMGEDQFSPRGRSGGKEADACGASSGACDGRNKFDAFGYLN